MKTLNLDFVDKLPYALISRGNKTLHALKTQTTLADDVAVKGIETSIRLDRKINDIADINSCFRTINELLALNGKLEGTFVDSSSPASIRTLQLPFLNLIIRFNKYIVDRLGLQNSYLNATLSSFSLKKNKNISKAEVLGRLIYCGFSINKISEKNGNVRFLAIKKSMPLPEQKVSDKLLYAMPRIGKNGKIIRVYKIRTMYPYSEFLQAYLKTENGYNQSGKINNDFRVTKWGKLLRKYWIDELPQLINVLKGEMKLVGFRPVSKTYFDDLPAEIKELRLNSKPGCIPPYVAMNKKPSVEGVLEAEKDYFDYCSKHRFTDIVFLSFAIYNILIKGKRSA